MTALTNAMNILPINYGRVENLNLFPSRSVRFRHITIEEHNGVLSLLPTQIPGAPATVGKRGKRKVRTFTIPHIPHDDVVLPEEVQGIRAFGSESELKALADVITDHLQLMRNKHAITLEHLRMGALKGIILDADGSELLNLYNEFEITPKVVNFALGTATTDVKRKCMEVLRHIEDNLSGEYMTGIHALVSPEFFDALTSHTKVKEAYERWQEGAALRNDMRSGFTFCGITFEEYRGQATDPEGTVRRFIEKDTGELALYESKNKAYMVQVLKQEPDKLYEIGEGQFVGKMLILEAKTSRLDVLIRANLYDIRASTIGKIQKTRRGSKVGKHEFIGGFAAVMPKGNSDYLPWITSKAGKDRDWSPPDIDEQVLVLSPLGELSLGIVLPGIYQEKYPALENKKEINSVKFQDGTKFTYDKEKHHLEIEVADKITLKAGGSSIEMTKSEIKLKAERIDLN
ncbi:hypothetical protein J6590_079699 [Homalodisca vitripennis]|nr:hypothetical protein J6590_079699 [Homalodisca vitripennis]